MRIFWLEHVHNIVYEKWMRLKNAQTFVFWTKPIAKGRPRVGRNGAIYTPKTTTDFEKNIRECIWQNYQCLYGPLHLVIEFHFKRGAHVPKKKLWRCAKPDLDNLAKSVFDAANGLLFEDDKQIVSLQVSKMYDIEDKIILRIAQIEHENE